MNNNLTAFATILSLGIFPAFASDSLNEEFVNPPDSARPGVYWYFLDGNLNAKEMVADLEAMKQAGLGTVLFLEVDLHIPKGPVRLMSEPWLETLGQTIRETERLGMNFVIGTGPGWSGSGGPWIKPEKSMQHLVHSQVETKGPAQFQAKLPVPLQLSTKHNDMKSDFYEDVAVYAFPSRKPVIKDIDEKALYFRDAFSSDPGVKPFLDPDNYNLELGKDQVIGTRDVVEITSRMQPDGTLDWEVPPGDWTILRMGRRPTGAATRPAPESGLGLESDKFVAAAIEEHLDKYVGSILAKAGSWGKASGLNGLHLDSWEMGSQNWTEGFLEEFKNRRGYDARPLLPIYAGRAIQSIEFSERFLWDVRKTAQELVLENHAEVIRKWAHERGLRLSMEFYDMNPAGDLDLGAVADVPMGEFWRPGGAPTAYSCIQAASIGHVMGRPVVGSEAFTSGSPYLYDDSPPTLKNQADWAFAIGINSFWFHTYVHQPLGDEAKPGIMFGGYGTFWTRHQTFWPMVNDVHTYLSRCSHLLRQGVTVSDILYLTPEGAPMVFRPPVDATVGDEWFPDKRGYSFDGCSPLILMDRAQVQDGEIAFPGGSSYRLLVLPRSQTMTPAYLRKIRDLVKAGATVVGAPPVASPSLSGYPECDAEVKEIAQELWGATDIPANLTKRPYGKGFIYWGGGLTPSRKDRSEYPLADSQWVWYPGESGPSSAPLGTRYFKRIIEVEPGKVLESARAWVAADTYFTLLVNGYNVDEGSDRWKGTIRPVSIESFLVPGKNSIAVVVKNEGTEPNPAGLLGAIELVYQDGSKSVFNTDEQWIAGREPVSGWELVDEKLDDWQPAEVIGYYDMEPWKQKAPEGAPLYPSYELTADLLKSLGVAEDFASEGPIRFTHRRTQDREVYFVANSSENQVSADCQFRVAAGAPQLWDPVTGEQRQLPEYSQKDGVTTIPMTFDKNQSFFVIFNKSAEPEGEGPEQRANFPVFSPLKEIVGPWEVAFDPTMGGPEKAVFDNLKDWTLSEDPGIKYYSGVATYKNSFDFKPQAGQRVYLDLGVVNEVARVRLNGKDLGAVWCAPWRAELTQALKTGQNQLEIEVANLWRNRLIGDQLDENRDVRELQWTDGLYGGRSQKTGRYTFSTYVRYDANSPLKPSGLIGPVTLVEAK